MGTGWGERLRGLFGSSAAPSALQERLQRYPALRLPHPGAPGSISPEQAQANLAAWTASLPARREALRDLLADVAPDITMPNAHEACDDHALVTDLHAWAGRDWPALSATLPDRARERWLANQRDGDTIAFSMTADVAMLIGESIRQRRDSLRWGVDQDPLNRDDGMETYQRIVLLGMWQPSAAQGSANTVEIDVESMVVHRLLKPNASSERFENAWTRLLEEAGSGAHEGSALV